MKSTRAIRRRRCGDWLSCVAIAFVGLAAAPALAAGPRTPARTAPPPAAPRAAPADDLLAPRVFVRLGGPAIGSVSWIAPRGASRFEVSRDGRVLATLPGEATSFSEGGLRFGTRYCWTVRALGAAGAASPPVDGCVDTARQSDLFDDDLAAPRLPAPYDVAASVSGRDKIVLTWKASRSAAGAVRYEVVRGSAAPVTAKEPTATFSHLATGSRHCFTVRARDAAGNASAPSAPVCAETPDVTPPARPTAVEVAAISSAQVTVSWNAATDDRGVVRYDVRRGSDKVGETTTELAWREDGLSAGVRYCYAVVAYDAAGNASAPGGPECITTPQDVPSAPIAVAASAAAEASVRVRWTRASDGIALAGFDVLRDAQVAATAPPSDAGEASAEVGGLSPAQHYCFAVRARSASGNLSRPSAEACATTPDLTPPAVPAALVARAATDRKVELRWDPAPDNVGTVRYEVARGDKTISSDPASSALEEGLEPGRSYCYAVTALDAAGNRSPPASACATTPDVTPPVPPTMVSAAAPTPTTVDVSWSGALDDVAVTTYEVLRDGKVVATAAQSPVAELNLVQKTEYCYRIVALDAAGHRSPPSASACVKTPSVLAVPAPRNVRAVATSARAVALTWDPPRKKLVYTITWDGQGVIGTTKETAFAAAALDPGEQHCFRIQATDDDGQTSSPSAPACATTPQAARAEH